MVARTNARRGFGWYAAVCLGVALVLAGCVYVVWLIGRGVIDDQAPQKLWAAFAGEWVWARVPVAFAILGVGFSAYDAPKTWVAMGARERRVDSRRAKAWVYVRWGGLTVGAIFLGSFLLEARPSPYHWMALLVVCLVPLVMAGVNAGIEDAGEWQARQDHLKFLQESREADINWRMFNRAGNPAPGPVSQLKAERMYEEGLNWYYQGQERVAVDRFKQALEILIDHKGTDEENRIFKDSFEDQKSG